jgi:hypothetical protein
VGVAPGGAGFASSARAGKMPGSAAVKVIAASKGNLKETGVRMAGSQTK